jgi:hypothetical protein
MTNKRVEYDCLKCGYKTNRKSNYDNHVKRKRPCVKDTNNGNGNNYTTTGDLDGPSVPKTTTKCTKIADQVYQPPPPSVPKTTTKCTETQHDHSCVHCASSFLTKRGLGNHMVKCRGVPPNQCEFCKATFCNTRSRIRHQKGGHCQSIVPVVDTHSVVDAAKQSPMVVNGTYNNGVINNGSVTNNTQNNTNNVTININAFGEEDISYLLNDGAAKLIKRVLEGKKEGMTKLFALTHFHPDHPENHNIRKLDKKDKFVETFDGSEWTEQFYQDALEEPFERLRQRSEQMLQGIIDSGGFEIHIKSKLDRFMDGIGEALGIDVTGDVYDRDYKMSEAEKEEQIEVLRMMMLKLIYRQSLLYHRQKHNMVAME